MKCLEKRKKKEGENRRVGVRLGGIGQGCGLLRSWRRGKICKEPQGGGGAAFCKENS